MAMEGGWLQLLTDSLFHSSSLFSMWDVTPFSKCMTVDSTISLSLLLYVSGRYI